MLAVSAVLAGACGDNVLETADAQTGPDASRGFHEAAHAAVPQVVNGGGPVLTAPVIVPIFFPGDDVAQAALEQFLPMLADPTNPYWAATTSEYGVGPLTIRPSIVSPSAPPTTDAALQTFLAANVGATGLLGAFDPQAIYTVFLPEGAAFSNFGGQACKAFGAYHFEVAAAGTPAIVYALVPRCHVPQIDVMPLDETTVSTSHELVEAATDPHFGTGSAYQRVDQDHAAWDGGAGSELGDMCEFVRTANVRIVGSFLVQRTWSNALAAAGHDPCVPAPATPYAGAAPVFVEDIPFGRRGMTKGVTAAIGVTATIEVDLFTDAIVPIDFDVNVQDSSAIFGGAPELSFELSSTHGNNGNKLQLLITRATASANGRGTDFVITTRIHNADVGMWWGHAAE